MCSEMSLCPCATGWCNNKQPSIDCIKFLATVISTRAEEIRNASGIIEYIRDNDTKDSEAIEYPPCPKVDGDNIPRCLHLVERQFCSGKVCTE